MKKVFSYIFFLSLFFVSSVFSAYLRNVPVTLTQPDGTIVKCFATGDEFHNWLHDKDNYTIVRNQQTGYLVYAIKKGGKKNISDSLISSTFIVGKANPKKLGIKPGLNLLPSQIQAKYASISAMAGSIEVQEAPTSGTLNNLVIFIRFSDQTEFVTPLTDYDDDFNATSGVSLHHYFSEVSNSTLDVSTTFYPVSAGTFPVSYQSSNPRNYYSPFVPGSNPIGYKNDTERTSRDHTLLENAVNAVSSQIPPGLNLDGDNDGQVDNVCFIIRGAPDGWSSLLWPHMWSLYTKSVYINGKRVWTYNFQLDDVLDPSVLCHEMFHSLGAPDLYHYVDDGIMPVGKWDVMEWNTSPPQHMTVYMKKTYGNWGPAFSEITEPGTYTLYPVSTSPYSAFKFASPNSSDEYFMIEYRRKVGTFETGLPASGLIIYRINTTVYPDGNRDGPPDEVYVFRPGGTPTVNGDVHNAVFAFDHGRTTFDDNTDPACFLTDGSAGGYLAGLGISNVSVIGDSMTFDFKGGSSASTIYNVIHIPSTPTNLDDVQVKANIMDDVSITSVVLTWCTDGSSFSDSVNMSLESGVTYATDTSIPSQSVGTTVSYRIRAINDDEDTTITSIYSYTVVAPFYCDAASNSNSYEYISHVQVGTIDNSSSSSYYSDYTSLSTDMDIGTGYSFTITIANAYTTDQVLIWIDWNRDYDFEDADEKVFTSSTGGGPFTGTITPPSGSVAGNTRMRIRLHDSSYGPNSTPCGNSDYGEVEDYTINVISPIPHYTLTVSATNGSVTRNPDLSTYPEGTEVIITTTPNQGYHFNDWSGDLVSTENPDTIIMDDDKSIMGNCVINTYTVTFVEGSNGSITGTLIQTIDHGNSCTEVTAVPDMNCSFTGWTGDYTGSDNPLTVTSVTADMTITANFHLEVVKGPYCQNVTPTSIVIMWETDAAEDSRVDFGTSAPDEDYVADAATETIHELELTGLSADTRYYYTVTSNGFTSDTYTFSTAPATERSFRFAAYGDVQRETPIHGTVVQGIKSHDPEFVFHTGDMVDDGTVYAQWGPQFFNQAQALICSTAFMPVIGNHEDWGGSPLYFKAFFSLPNNEEWYAYTYSNTRFIALNTEAEFVEESSQYIWLESELQSAEFTNATWHIIYFHRPAFTAARHSDIKEDEVKTHLVPLFEQYDVDMVFNGHSHLYERYYHNGIHYFVIGGGGMELDELDDEEDSLSAPYRQVGIENYHYCIFDVDVPGLSLALSVRDTNGVELDGVTLCKHIITATAGANGSINPSGVVKVKDGTDTTFTITPDSGFQIDSVLVDGTNQGTPATVPFTNVTADHTIEAFFSLIPTITVTYPNGGETFVFNTSQTITWICEGTIGNVMIEYSLNNGSDWTTITASTPNDSSYTWTLPNDTSSYCLIRIRDAVYGYPVDVSDATFTIQMKQQDIPLNSGWSIVSFSMDPIDYSVSAIFGDIPSLVLVKNNVGQVYMPPDIDNIGSITISDGYKVYTTENEILTVQGFNFYDYTMIPVPLSLGWNMIAYLPEEAMPIETALLDIVDDVKIVKNNIGDIYMPEYGINYIGDMIPGEGYKIYMEAAGSLYYPEPPTVSATVYTRSTKSKKQQVHFTWTSNTGNNMTIIIPAAINPLIDSIAIEAGDEIGVFTPTGLCVGGGVWQGSNIALTVWGDDDQTSVVDGIKYGETLQYRLWDAFADKEYGAAVTYTSGGPGYTVDGIAVLASLESVEPATLTVTEPNGGETVRVGDVFTITWSCTGTVGDVRIEYTHDNGVTWDTIADAVSNTGSYAWTIPATLSTTCKLRISEALDGDPVDTSDDVFTIDNATPIENNNAVSSVATQFIAVPNPVDLGTNDHTVSFILFTQYEIVDANIQIFDALGNMLETITPRHRQTKKHDNSYELGSWNFRNTRGIVVSSGSYCAVLRITHSDGTKAVYKNIVGIKGK